MGLTLGNGFSPVSLVTPFGSLSTTLRFVVKDRLGLFLRARLTHQRFDYTSYSPMGPSNQQAYDVNIVDRLTYGEAQFGFVFSLYPSRDW